MRHIAVGNAQNDCAGEETDGGGQPGGNAAAFGHFERGREQGPIARGDHDAAGEAEGDVERGRKLLTAYGCGSCHEIPGVPGARSMVGPPLTDFGVRQYVAGDLVNTPVSLVRWIADPQSIEPGTVMPDLGVTPPEALDMAAYLYTLR